MSVKSGIAIGAGALLLIVACVLGFNAAFVKSRSVPDSLKTAAPSSETTWNQTFESLAKQVEGAIVNIHTEQTIKNSAPLHYPFREFLVNARPYARTKEISLGSGFMVNSNGYILTNSRVVENASRIRVKLNDNRIMEGVVVGTDPKTDLAVLKIGATGLPALSFAASNSVNVGEWVAAFGSSFGLDKSITAGIISAKRRTAGSEIPLLQTDAAINSENNGGPLVNLHGEVVGVNIAASLSNRRYNGIGFAIPSETVQKVYRDLTKGGEKKRGWIGALIQEVSPEIAGIYKLPEGGGAIIIELAPDGPAAKAGLQPGDIVIEYNKQPVRAFRDLSAAVMETRIGSTIWMRIVRRDKELVYSVLVGERPASIAERFNSPNTRNRGKLGITVENVTPEIRSLLHLSSVDGVIVIEVASGSPAEDGGVQPGDVIHQINHLPVRRTNDLISALGNLDDDENTVLLNLERQGARFFMTLRLD
jgi:serine protease Do